MIFVLPFILSVFNVVSGETMDNFTLQNISLNNTMKGVSLRENACAVADAKSGILFITGGIRNSTENFQDFWAFHIQSNVWQKLPAPSQGRVYASCALVSTESAELSSMLLVGGLFSNYYHANDTAISNYTDVFNFTTKKWEQQGNLFADLSLNSIFKGAVTMIDDVLYFTGGLDQWENELRDTIAVDLSKGSNARKLGMLPQPLYTHKSFTVEDRLYVLGGMSGNKVQRSFFMLKITGEHPWVDLPSMHQPRSDHACAVMGNKMVVLGGSIQYILPSIEVFDFDTNVWAEYKEPKIFNSGFLLASLEAPTQFHVSNNQMTFSTTLVLMGGAAKTTILGINWEFNVSRGNKSTNDASTFAWMYIIYIGTPVLFIIIVSILMVKKLACKQKQQSSILMKKTGGLREFLNVELGNIYTLGKHLGSGSFGSVYLAECMDGTLLAVKVVHAEHTEHETLLREVEIMSRIPHHDNVVKCHTSRREGNDIHILMEYCEGGSLGKLCREMNEPMPYAKVREYARQILQGLAHLHSHGVIHRDIKGDNVLLYHGVVKLADFGTAKRFGGAGIGMNSITGTPTWSAPEMLTNSTLEGCSPQVADVWSVGCTVVEMLTKGEGPWPKFENLFQAVTTIVHHQGMPPNVPTSLPEDLNNFLRCCFEYEPSKRPSAAELLKHAFLRPPLTLSMLKEHIRQSPEVRASDEETVGSSWSDSLGVPIHTSF